MEASQRQSILNNLQHIEPEDLYSYIKSGDIGYDEMKATGKLNYKKQEAIEGFLDKDRNAQAEEKRLWNECQAKRTVQACLNFIRSYPDSIYAPQANALKLELEDEIVRLKHSELERLKDPYSTTSRDFLLNLLEKGIITKDDLYDHGIITPQALQHFLSPPQLLAKYKENWNQLPTLPKGHTDAYMFGMPGSGKTMVLAGLMYSANRQGILDMNIDNTAGVQFKDQMIQCIEMGYVLPPTPEEALNYISASIHIENPKKRSYPLSFVDMSGEHFVKTYENAGMGDDISAKEYLRNNNRKLILFFIDYFQAATTSSLNSKVEQDQKLQYALSLFDKDGTLAKTDAMHFIITKSDLMPEGENREQHATQFLNENHKNLVNTAKRYCQKHNINAPIKNKIYVTPFSLGKFMLEKTFLYNQEPSNKLLHRILGSVAAKRKGKWYDRF